MDIGDKVTAHIRTIRGYEDYTGVVTRRAGSNICIKSLSTGRCIMVNENSILK